MLMADDQNVVQIVKLRPYKFREIRSLPRRPWIMRGLILRKQITAMIAAGGVGKSMFGLVVACHLAAGQSFGPYKVDRPYRVAILTVEEDADELDRRLHAIRKHFGFSEEIAKNLFIVEMDDPPIIAEANRKGVMHETPKLRILEKVLFNMMIDVIMADPFIELWNGAENDNSQVRAALSYLRGVVRRIECGCLLNHHVRKGAVTPGDVDAGRGASSFGGLVRIAKTITHMSPDDAASLGVKNPKGILRVDSAKGNYLSPVDEAHWFRFMNVDLENVKDGEIAISDKVGVIAPWQPPGLFENVTYEAIDAALDVINAGLDGERFSFAAQSKERYVVAPIARQLNIEAERAERIMKCWRQSGLLYEDDYTGHKSRSKKGVFVDAEKRPSAKVENG